MWPLDNWIIYSLLDVINTGRNVKLSIIFQDIKYD